MDIDACIEEYKNSGENKSFDDWHFDKYDDFSSDTNEALSDVSNSERQKEENDISFEKKQQDVQVGMNTGGKNGVEGGKKTLVVAVVENFGLTFRIG